MAAPVTGAGDDRIVGYPIDDHLAYARFRARESPAAIGAAVVESLYENDAHVWDCVVTDCREWRYIRVVGPGLAPWLNLPPEQVDDGIERFAATLPEVGRIHHLVNANPLHIDRAGTVSD